MSKIISFIALFLSMFIKTYKPQRVYVSKSALSYPRTQHIIRRIKKLNRKALIIHIPTNTPPRPNLDGKALYKYLKGTIVICTRSAPYMEIFASPGRISENLGVMGKIIFHCSLQCLFCYLDVAGRGTPWTRVYVDMENFYSQAVQERFVYKISLTLWSAISFHLKTPLNKVPEKFKEICDQIIRREILKKRSSITSDKEAIKYLKNHLREFFLKMNIQITNKQIAELKKAIPGYYAKNSQLTLSINISEYSDVLGLDHITNTLDELMQLVHQDPEFRIRFRTKAANIQNLLKYDGKNQVKITFGLNTEYVIEKYEKGTASLTERIAAINALLQRGGYEIDLAIEPIIKYSDYENDYKDLINRLKREINMSRIGSIKVGTVRYKTRLKNYITQTHPNSGLSSRNQQLCEPEPGDKRWRYSKEERLKIYQAIKDEIKSVPSVKVGLGSENPELWDELGLDKGDIHSGVVYQYSADENNNNSKSKLTISSLARQGCNNKRFKMKKEKNEITITQVREESGWLSCMSAYPVTYEGTQYKTCEALFQALRFIDHPNIQKEIQQCPSPMGAKMIARRERELLGRGKMWDEAPSDIPLMKKCLKLKLEQHHDLKNKLVATSDATIIEDCTTHDRESARFWGAVKKDGKWIGENVFGKLWMEIREEVIEERNK